MPEIETLPPDLHSLLRRQALKLDDSAFDYHVSELIEALEREIGPATQSGASSGGTATAAQPAREERPAPVYTPVASAQPKKPRRLLWLGLGAGLVIVFLGLALIGYIMEEFSSATADPQATQAFVNAIQSAQNAQAQTPQQNAAPPPAAEPAPVAAPAFEPVGRWRISLGEGLPASLLVNLESNGEFSAQSEAAGFSFPASAGAWNYNRGLRLLSVTGINNLGVPFQALFQNVRYHAGHEHFHAFVPGQGEVQLSKE
jgi:hypothetical protein